MTATESQKQISDIERGSKVNSYRKTAVIVGVLFIIGTVAGVLSGVLFTLPILGAPDSLAEIYANETQWIMGALMVLIMGLPLAMVPVILFPILKKYGEALALGAVVFRGALEAVCYMAIVGIWLSLIMLSQEYVKAGAPDASYFQTLGTLLLGSVYWSEHILAMVFSIGALMIYYLFYVSRLIPRWLSIWGLVGATIYLAAPLFNMFDPQHPPLSVEAGVGLLMAPLALQEMVFALWLIVKGFNTSAIASESAK